MVWLVIWPGVRSKANPLAPGLDWAERIAVWALVFAVSTSIEPAAVTELSKRAWAATAARVVSFTIWLVRPEKRLSGIVRDM